ncbi:MAG: Crp/Fnr family transcriptional regulator [Schaedlerella sp.]|nr:Crp/Fnr family transcriptional regulator [Schaedlerella sp.]
MNWNIIQKTRMFEQLSPEQTKDIFTLLSPRKISLDKNDILIRDGQTVDFFAIVESGELAATKLYGDGTQSLLLKFPPSYMAGVDIAATKKKISTYYVTAVKATVVYLIDFQRIAKPGIIPESERLLIMESILALIAAEHIRKMNKIEILSRKGLRDKILTYLGIHRSFIGKDEFDIPYNREELADYLCVNRSALSHELSNMESEGLISCRKKHFKILKAELYRRVDEKEKFIL